MDRSTVQRSIVGPVLGKTTRGIAFLASAEARFVQGAALVVDSGRLDRL